MVMLLIWAVAHGGGKEGDRSQGGRQDPPSESEIVLVPDAPFDPQNVQMQSGGPLWSTFEYPSWPFDTFTSNAIAGMVATNCPPIPDAMLASGLALYRVMTNTVLMDDTGAVAVEAWTRHGADNRGVWVNAPFAITLGTSTYARVGVLANGRLAFGYATYHRQPVGDLPFETPYPVVTVAPLWGPFALLPSAGSVAWTRAIDTNRFLVCWQNLLLDGDPARPATVQCEIRRDGTMQFLYGTLAEGVAESSTVGIQNLGQGWTYSHGQTNRVVAGMDVSLRPVGFGGWTEADPDSDLLSNFDEFMLGTDPLKFDTDGDGPSDLWELNHGYDPLVAQLAPPDLDTDSDGIPDRWENWMIAKQNNAGRDVLDCQDYDEDGFVTWYESYVLGSHYWDPASPGPPEVEYTDVMAVITSCVPCVLTLSSGGANTIELPWMPGVSPVSMRLRLVRGQEYEAMLSRVPDDSGFTTNGFWWADLSFEAATGIEDLGLPATTDGGVVTYYVGTVCVQAQAMGADFWAVPGQATASTNSLAVWRIGIEQPNYVFCYSSTSNEIRLAAGSLVDGPIEWVGLPPVEVRTGDPLVFDPSTVTPGHYTVTARAARNHLVTAQTEVDIYHVGLTQSTVWLSADDSTWYDLPLSEDTYPIDGLYVWSEPEGITSLSFPPDWIEPGAYTVYVSDGACGQASMTVNILNARIVPDFNHDRVIDGSDVTTNTFHFWINDDADFGDVGAGYSDSPGFPGGPTGTANCSSWLVCGRCDLLDFSPVWLDLNQTLNILPPGDTVQYKLKQADAAVKAVYTDLATHQAGEFLTTEADIYGPSFNQPSFMAYTFDITGSGVTLSAGFLNKIANDETKGILLIEGAAMTTSPLVLEVWKDGVKVFEKQMALQLSGVERMYRWINLRGSAGGVVDRVTDTNQPPNYPDTLSNGKQVVFVHGYNVAEDMARGWNAEMFKRLYQSGSRAMFTAVTWHGNDSQGWWWLDNTPNYYINVTHAFETASNLVAVVNALPGQITVAAHSLGNMLVSSAIKDHGLNVNAYFMLDAAVAEEAYDSSMMYRDEMRNPDWQNYSNRLWSAEWHQLFNANDGRHNLTWRDRFGNIGVAYNYYSSGEDVLNNGDGTLHAFLAVEWAWVNQEMRKGVWPLLVPGNNQAGWGWSTAYTNDDGTYPLLPATANALTDDNIRTNSFFRWFDNYDLYGANGSALAQDWHMRAQVLADGIPALSRAAGRNPLNSFGSGTIDMMTQKNSGAWPQERLNNQSLGDRWLHSDIKNVAYFFLYPVFDSLVQQGDLQ